MFCNKCGNKLEDTAKFCPACGKKIGSDNDENGTNNNVNKIDVNAYVPIQNNASFDISALWQPLVSAAIIIFIFLQDWFKVDLGFVKGTYSISAIKDVLDTIIDYGINTSDIMSAITLVNILHFGTYVVIIAEILFILAKLIDHNRYKTFGTIGGLLSVLIAIVIIVLRAYISTQLADNFGSAYDSFFSLTWYPYILFVLVVWQFGTMDQG